MRRVGKYTKQRKTRAAWLTVNTYILWFRNLKRWQKISVIVTPILIVLILIPLLTYLYFARDISDKERLMNRNNTGIVLTDVHGTTIYESGRAKHRDLVPLSEMNDTTKKALLASEDKDFYNHGGFSFVSMLGAVYGNVVTGGKNYGGSTLTQQLAKNTLLTDQKSYLRKFQELSVSIAIEQTYSKDEILEMYLNSAFFGGNAFGIGDAARTFFNKSPKDLTLAESAMIIGVLPAPNAYSPIYGEMKYAKERQETVLNRMLKNGFITQAEKDQALAQQLAFAAPESSTDNSPAPHFAEMVLADLNKRYGEEKVARSGYQVKTTLDLNMQAELQDNINKNMTAIRRSGGSNAAAVAIDPKTGAIRALIGSYDWNDEQDGKVNMVTSARQPGSSFKPIYYAAAMADGVINPATILKDEPINIDGYQPKNALRNYNGNVTVRKALNWSLNIPAVKVMQQYGVDKSIEAANRMGIDTIQKKNNYGLSLALGAGEAKLLDMTHAYAGFANGGDQKQVAYEEEIKTKYDQIIYKNKEQSKRVISEEGAFLISNVLSDNQARSGMFGSSLSLSGNKKAAVKTGTTDENRDAWTIGYTPSITVGVWVGNNDNTEMSSGGGSLAGPIWRNSMNDIVTESGDPFKAPSGVVQKDTCYGTGKLASTSGGNTYKEYYLSSALPEVGCNVQTQQRQEEKPKEEEQDTSKPVETSLSVAGSPNGSAPVGTSVTFTASVSAADATGTVTFMIDGASLGSATVSGGKASITSSSLPVGTHQLSATFTSSDPTKFKSATSSSATYLITTNSSSSGNNGNAGTNGQSTTGGAR
ncbi:PBP1A family penicillin-binding protein [Candidatus Mycosynbacter amalyticus]|uniref:PBP1A family penicillin-binding protein n=1 Tax=Candidatus Mycosynbacter amalyticus TaxID=2665156 RepID=A0A857MKT0_9BACT|nr:PBP1A family penicillin-binding protein [Candidatus Mycosynbacter amalyticus]QHN43163.1 PBP1A family penicillin-binding protein [Candidatus Mycosynbacter amalyticus]